MDFSHFKISLIYLIVLIEGSVLKRRIKRYPTPPLPVQLSVGSDMFAAILNQSVPITCPENQIPHKRVAVSADSLKSMLVQKGGVYIPHLMAEEDDLDRKFHNLLNTGASYDEADVDSVFPSVKSPIYKSQLEDDLRKWSMLSDNLKSANNSSQAKSTNINSSSVKQQYFTSSQSVENEKISKLDNSVKRAIEHRISNFLVQNGFTLDELLSFVRQMKIKTHPKILMGLDLHRNRRKKRNIDGSISTTQYCAKTGTEKKAGFLSLCEECAITTRLPSDRFPRLLNEVVCGTETTCLKYNRIHPQGVCSQSIQHLTLLRRVPGGCRMMINTGDHIFVDEWEPYTQTVRTGCECVLDKRSKFAANFGLNGPVVG